MMSQRPATVAREAFIGLAKGELNGRSPRPLVAAFRVTVVEVAFGARDHGAMRVGPNSHA